MHRIQIPHFSFADHRNKIYSIQFPTQKLLSPAASLGRYFGGFPQADWGNYFAFVVGTSAAEEWVNLRLAAGQGPAAAADIAAIRGQAANYPGQILQFQMSTQS